MKPLLFFPIALTVILSATCDNRMYNDRENAGESTNNPAISEPWKDERAAYLDRMNRKIENMEREIRNQRSARTAEKRADRIRDFDTDIKRREKSRNTLREKIDNLDKATEENWGELKQDIDEFFESEDHDSSVPK